MWALVGLVFVVASLGVANTLTMNVLEQTRELGALRATGMRRGACAGSCTEPSLMAQGDCVACIAHDVAPATSA